MAARAWWKFTPDMCKSPEATELAKIIELPTFAAAGAIALLYVWAIGKADDGGNINEYTTKAIETACMWDGKRGELLKAFHASGVIIGDIHDRDDNDPLRIANWGDVAADILKERQQMRDRAKKHRDKKTGDVTGDVTPHKSTRVQEYQSFQSDRVQEQKRPCELHEVELFCAEKKLIVSAQKFFEHYDTAGWMQGNTPVTNWKGLLLAWDKADREKATPALAYDQRDSTDYSGHIIDLSKYANE